MVWNNASLSAGNCSAIATHVGWSWAVTAATPAKQTVRPASPVDKGRIRMETSFAEGGQLGGADRMGRTTKTGSGKSQGLDGNVGRWPHAGQNCRVV